MAEDPLNAAKKKEACEEESSNTQFETMILENSIMKICSLLAVGFGEAGTEIIGENMRMGGNLNPMIPGRKMMAIFGFCDIRQFTDTTEVLQVRRGVWKGAPCMRKDCAGLTVVAQDVADVVADWLVA